MTTEDALDDLLAWIRRKLPGITISRATNLRQDIPFDSLDRMELLVKIEQVHGVVVTPDEYLEHHLEIVGNLAAFIATRQTVHHA